MQNATSQNSNRLNKKSTMETEDFGMQYDVITTEVKQAQEANRQLVSKIVVVKDKNLQLDTQAAVLSK